MANRYWVGGAGDWDVSTTTHWSDSSGGAGGQSVPGSSDTAIFDAASGGGTVTPNYNLSVVSITMGAFTGTLDFSANNNSPTLATFSCNGTGTRTLKMGTGTFTLTGVSDVWIMNTVTNLTLDAGQSTIKVVGTVGLYGGKTIYANGLILNKIWYSPVEYHANNYLRFYTSGTYSEIKLDAGTITTFLNSTTTTVTTFVALGTAESHITISNTSLTTHATLTKAGGGVISGCDYIDIQEITGSPADTWYIGSNSTDTGSTCTNIYLLDEPAVVATDTQQVANNYYY